MYILSLTSNVISNVIPIAQIKDIAMRDLFDCRPGFEIFTLPFICGKDYTDVTPFGDSSYGIIISLGLVLLGIGCLTFSINSSLNDNILLQWFADVGLLFIPIIWLSIFYNNDTIQIDYH